MERGAKTRIFGGRRYDRAGMSPTRSKKVADSWADFQRRVNKLLARVVKAPSTGYEIYVRRRSKQN